MKTPAFKIHFPYLEFDRSYRGEPKRTLHPAQLEWNIQEALAENAARVVEEARRMSMTMTVVIVGCQYHPGALEYIRFLDTKMPSRPNWKLMLKREPENRHDKNAVAVYDWTGKKHLGYVPRQDAVAVAKVMDNGIRIKATYIKDKQVKLWWPASNKEDLEREYRRAMSEGEGL